MSSRRLLAVAISLVVLAVVVASPRGTVAQGARADGPRFMPNEVIVKFRAGTAPAVKSFALARASAQAIDRLSVTPAAVAAGDLELVHTPMAVADAIARLRDDASVEYAEPNWIYTWGRKAQLIPNDPGFGQLWGLNNTGQSINGGTGGTPDADIDAPEAWAARGTGSASTYVGVIDEGIDFKHPDLAGQVWTNPWDPVDGIDNDGNGYVDDVHGWDFANNDNTIYDGKPHNSTDAHGTHVSGTIGAKGNNSTGVAGVNWAVTIISAKFLGRNGGTTANAVKAVDYITDLKIRHGLNIAATNNSWGGGGFSQALLDAITRAAKQDILFVAAAGNGDNTGHGIDNDSTSNYPSNYNTQAGAGYDSVIAVAALDRFDKLATWSNYGKTTVDLGAPGVTILSTVPGSSYAYYSGTSMATPHVTGVAALANAARGYVGSALKSVLLSTTVPVSALSGKTVTGGRVNAANAVR
jgi:subtilisin family serine protease